MNLIKILKNKHLVLKCLFIQTSKIQLFMSVCTDGAIALNIDVTFLII